MKVLIETISPDGLSVLIKSSFVFMTWDEVFEFIRGVDDLEIEIDKRSRLSSKEALKYLEKIEKVNVVG